MAEALVTIAAEGILKKVLSLAAAEIVLAWGYQEKLTGLHETLDLIRAKLHDAERHNGTKAVMVWLKQLKCVVSDADDVLDEIHYEMLRREVKKRDRMTRKDSFDRETDPYLEEEFKIFGRENDELQIIQLLTQLRREGTLTIVPIVGMGGIGKTTLAKSIYNNPKIDQHFDVKAWLCVSVKVDVNTLLAKIYESLAGEEPKSQMRVNLITHLQKKLGSKKYLLVLDDVWDEEKAHWDDFRSCMLKVHAESGSGILVTTRNHEIGAKVMSEGFHALEGLSSERSWSIFKERAFLAGQPPLPEFEKIGRDIVIKCRGLPLLINVIGAMLRNCDKEKWLSIKDSKVWDLIEDGDRVQNSLNLSFDNLPNSIVKQCFAYCSMFEKDKVMERDELIRLWMALGLVQADERTNKEAEDVGNDIFRILVSSSLFQDVKVDEYGYITCCMHDLVHDLSISLSKHESLRLVGPTSDDITRITQVKHLVVLYPDWKDKNNLTLKEMISVVFKEDMAARTLQTLIFKGEVEKNISFQRFKCVRVLKFNRCRLEKIDSSIGELVHLRYLDFSNTYIHVLPESMGKLYHLQTLKLDGTWLEKWPKDVHHMISMRHLMVQGNVEKCIPIPNVGQLTSLRSLPYFIVGQEKRYQIAELGPLKHLAGHLSIVNLENLTCLSNPLGEGVNVTGSMTRLSPSLRSLRLERMKRLERWIDAATTNSSTMLSPVLESLYITDCPKITHLDECHPHPLVSLKIFECKNLVSIKSIQGLTSLESLKIHFCPSLLEIGFWHNYKHHPLKLLSISGNEKLTSMPRFDCFSFLNTLVLGPFSEELHSFPSLQGIEKSRNHLYSLELYGWEHWESIPEEIKCLTSLTQLIIQEFGIQELPMWLTNMSSIRDISFYDCKRLDKETVKRGLPRGADHVSLDYKSCK